MCNKIAAPGERNCKEIPKEGYGWKLFHKSGLNLYSLMDDRCYDKDEDGWIQWKEEYCTNKEDGFCFFLDKKEAYRALLLWMQGYHWTTVKKIAYEEGIQERDESLFVGGKTWRVSLCRKFKIVEE